MADARGPAVVSSLTPERVARADFGNSFRGFDPTEVRGFLARVAGELRALLDRQSELMATITELERRPAPVVETLDERRVTALLGAETARVLDAARDAAAGIKANAEEQAARVLSEAEAVAEELRGKAQVVLGDRTAEAEAEAARIRGEAEAEAERVLADGRAKADRLLNEAKAEAERLESEASAAADRLGAEASSEAERVRTEATTEAERVRSEATSETERVRSEAVTEAERLSSEAKAEAERLTSEAQALRQRVTEETTELLDRSREDGRRMVAEARAVRERILTDMARRRNQARQQLEKLRAGRERLIDAFEVARKVVDETSGELSASLVEARLAGERAARQVDVDTIPPMNELDAEVELAKDAGLIDVDAISRAVHSESGEAPTADAAALSTTGPSELDEADGGQADGEPDGGDADDALDLLDQAVADDVSSTGELDGGTSTDQTDQPTTSSATPPGQTGQGGLPDTGPEETGATPQRRVGFSVKVEDLFNRWKDDDAPSEGGPSAAVDEGTAVVEKSSEHPHDSQRSPEVTGVSEASADTQIAAVATTTAVQSGTSGARASSAKGARRTKARDNAKRPGRATAATKGTTKTDGTVSTPDPVAERETVPEDGPSAEPSTDDATESASADEVPASADQVAMHTRDAVLAGAARDLARQLKLTLSDEQNLILERIRAGSITDAPTAAELAAPYRTVARRELVPALEAGWRSVAEKHLSVVGDVDQRLLDRVVDDVVSALTDPVRERLESVLRDVDDPAERVRNLFRETRNQRVIGLAEHATLAAFGEGQLAASKKAPDALTVRWVFEDCTPDCLDNSLAGELPPGEAFPTGHFHPPTFVGCRCLLAVGGPLGDSRDHIARPAV